MKDRIHRKTGKLIKTLVVAAALALVGGSAFGDTAKSAALGYVTDGLVAHWDAIDNVGSGTHDSAATTWVDLVNGITLQLDSSTSAVGADYMKFTGSNKVTSEFTKFGWADSTTVDVTARAGTLPSGWKTLAGKTIFSLQRRSTLAFDLRKYSKNSGVYLTYPITPTTSKGLVDYDYMVTEANPQTAIQTVHHYAVASSMNERTAYYDGAKTTVFTMGYTFGYDDEPDGTCIFGGTDFAPQLNAVRVYNRKLTDDEVAWNCLVDRLRYCGEAPLSTLAQSILVVGAIPAQEWDGSNVPMPELAVSNRISKAQLSEGVDYEVGAVTQAGGSLGQVTVTGLGVYAGCTRICQFPLVRAVRATVFQKGTSLSAKVSFPAADRAREIYVAGADADAGGEGTNGWAVVAKFGDVAPGETVLTARLPEAVVGKAALRFFVKTVFTSADYKTDGLGAQWDGIENAGRGTRTESPAVWKDLIGSSDITIPSWVSVNSDKTGFLSVGSTVTRTYPTLASIPALTNDSVTIEVVAKRVRWNNTGNYNSVQYLASSPWGQFGYRKNETKGLFLNDSKSVLFNNNTTGVDVRTINTLVGRFTLGSSDGELLANATKLSLVNDPTALAVPTTWRFFCATRTDIEIYAMRVYNRRLTDEEIAWNCLVDRQRYLGVAVFESSDPVVAGVTQAKFSGRTVTVTSAASDVDRRVVAVWGTSDGGAGVAGWEHVAALGVLPANETSASFGISKEFLKAPVKRLLVSSVTGSDAYAKGGLLLHYDGIDNALTADGVRWHDSTATAWADLSGNAADVALPGWAQVESRGVLSQALADKRVPTLTSSLVNAADELTVEYVMNHRGWVGSESRTTSGSTCFTTPLGYAYYRVTDHLAPNGDIALFTFRWKANTGNQLDLGFWTIDDKKFSALHTFSIHFKKAEGDEGVPRLILDGTTQCPWTEGNYPVASNAFCEFLKGAAANIGVAAIRVYDRELTDDETQANAALDQARFFGETAPASYQSTPAFGEISYGLIIVIE